MKLVILILSISLFALPNFASELILSKAEALNQGFKKTISKTHSIERSFKRAKKPTSELTKNSLPWPVEFIDQQHTIGNSMVEYQNYSNEAYFHGGDDLRVTSAAEVKAPIDGFLEGHYYTYVTDPNTGQLTKYSKPMSEGGDDLYFEISIQTSNHYSFEFHHVNPKTLPQPIYDMILNGGGSIHQGDLIGYTSTWPVVRYGDSYHHIHYNIISSTGVNLNPEYYSHELTDTTAPEINHIFAIYRDKKIEVLNQKLSAVPEEIILESTDKKGNNIYPLPPVFIEARWNENNKSGWDFTQNLFSNSKQFPDIRNVYATNLRLSDGRTFSTEGNYNNVQFLFRLKIPPTAIGPITLTVKDVSGNTKTRVLNIE